MATSRDRGGNSVTSRPSMLIVPPVASSRPAIMRRSVDLPQPEGPTRTRNSPLWISSETSSTATTPPPKTLLTRSSTIPATSMQSIPGHGEKRNGIDQFWGTGL